MNIGIIFAMDEEKDAFFALFDRIELRKTDQLSVYTLFHPKHNIYAIKTGVGKVHAAFKATLFMERHQLDVCINTGISGGLNVQLSDIVIGKKYVQHDVDVTPFDYMKGEVPGLPPYYKADEKLLKLLRTTLTGDNVHVGTLVSGDCFVTRRDQLNGIDALYDDVYAIDMESAAIAQCAYLRNLPFLAFRTISDLIDTDNQMDTIEKQAGVAIETGAHALRKLCDQL